MQLIIRPLGAQVSAEFPGKVVLGGEGVFEFFVRNYRNFSCNSVTYLIIFINRKKCLGIVPKV